MSSLSAEGRVEATSLYPTLPFGTELNAVEQSMSDRGLDVLFKKVRRARVQTKRDGQPEARDWLCHLRQCLSRSSDREKKSASPQQYVEGLNGEPARRSLVSAHAVEASRIVQAREEI